MACPMLIGCIVNVIIQIMVFFFLFQLICVGTFAIAVSFFSVYDMAVDTLFLCFCKYNNSVHETLINSFQSSSNLIGCSRE